MNILFAKSFTRQYWKLQDADRRRADVALSHFRRDPFDPKLRNHPLRGSLHGKRSISAGFDLRIVFEERDEYTVVIMLGVGSHGEVY